MNKIANFVIKFTKFNKKLKYYLSAISCSIVKHSVLC